MAERELSHRVKYIARQLRHDSRSNRNRMLRFLIGSTALIIPTLTGLVLGYQSIDARSAFFNYGLFTIITGLVIPFVLNINGMITGRSLLNYISGEMNNFGPGLNFKLPTEWGSRDVGCPDDQKSRQRMQIITVEETEEYDTKGGHMRIKFGYQYMIDLRTLDVYIGVDNESIEKGLTGIISGFISTLMDPMTATEARSAVDYIGFMAQSSFVDVATPDTSEDNDVLRKLQDKFGDIKRVQRNGDGMREREAEYGIKLLTVYVADIDFPDSVKDVFAARTENVGLLMIVAENMGIDPALIAVDNPDRIQTIKLITSDTRFDKLMEGAEVISGNASKHVSSVTGNAGAALVAAGTRLLGDSDGTGAPVKQRRGRDE